MNAPATSIVTCVEGGALEAQVLMLATSLRRFGGQWNKTPIVAVKPRRGPRLRRTTVEAFRHLDVRFVDENLVGDLAWWPHANKPAALLWADTELSTPFITWMDSDMVFLREPHPFVPDEDCAFVARPGEAFDVASSGDDDRAAFWHAVCARRGLRFDSFPNIISFPDGKPIKAYWQAGLFSFRRGGGLATCYRDVMADMLRGDIASKMAGVYHVDQVSLAVAVAEIGAKTCKYSPVMNLNLNPDDPGTFALFPLNEVQVVHYHGSFWPKHFDWAQRQLDGIDPDQRALIAQYAPFDAGSLRQRLYRKLLGRMRERAVQAYKRRAIPI